MGQMPVLVTEYNIAAFVTDKVFVIRGNQQEAALPETSCAAMVRQVEVPPLPFNQLQGVAQECNPLAALADVQS